MTDVISIIVPAYNSARYLTEAIKSVQQQTYSCWELIIVDDHSSDNTFNLSKQFSAKDQRIHCFMNEGEGVGAARNTGLSKVNGQYIAFLDADDYLPPNFLQDGYKKLSQGSDCVVFNLVKFLGDEQKNVIKTGTKYWNAYTGSPNKIVKKELWCGMHYPTDSNIEDLQLIPSIVAKAKNVQHVDTVSYYYRINETSLTHTETIDEAAKILPAVERMIKNLKEVGVQEDINMASFANRLVLPHIVNAMQDKVDRKTKKNFIAVISKWLKNINNQLIGTKTIYFEINRIKRIRSQIVMLCYRWGMYSLGTSIMIASWNYGSKSKK